MSARIWTSSIVVSFSLILIAVAAPPSHAATATGSPSVKDAPAEKVAERPDRVSAMVTARVQKSRVEDVSARTPSTATFANPDGTWTTESYAGIVRSKVDEGSWVSVDPAVQKRSDGYEPKATAFDASFSDGGDKTVGSVTTPTDATIRVGWPTKLPAPQAEGDTLTYPDAAAQGADLVVNSYRDGFDYSVVLDHAPAADAPQIEYRVPLTFDGATPIVRPDGSIAVKDDKQRVATMTAPVMWDSAQPAEDGPAERIPVDASVEGAGASRTLVLRPNMDYLRDPARVWPVVVDPSVALDVAGDTWADSLSNQASQYASPELRVGSNDLGITKSRSFMYFDFTPVYSMAPGVLTSAEVRLSNFVAGSCAGTAVRMSRITGPWSTGGLTWGNQPAVTATGSSTSTDSHGATGCTAEGTVTFDATAIATAWFLEGAPIYGVRFSADNESVDTGWREYRSIENGDPAKAPKLVLTWNAYPNTPTGVSVSPGYNGYASSTTPTLSAVVSDPDGGQVRGSFQVKSGSTVVWSGTSPMAPSGSRVSVTVPSGLLADGTYSATVRGQDTTLTSQNATNLNFAVDTTPPATTITSSAFTNGGWLTTMPSSSTFTYHGPADTGGFYLTIDGIAAPPLAANSSGDYVQNWTPVPGWHTVEVAAVDKAGNRGTSTTFSFGTGAAEFSTPSPWAESTSSVPIDASAPSSATGATLSWQVYGETTWHTATQATEGGVNWTGYVTTGGGRSKTPVLEWKATEETLGSGKLTAPALVLIRTCFHYASAADSCTANRPVVLAASARGGNYPEAQVGPMSVALFTGEAALADVDAADSKAGLGRIFSAFDDATLHPGAFGPGWSEPSIVAPSADAKARVVDNRTKDGSLVIVDPMSGSQIFALKQDSTTEYTPVHPTGDATKLTFTAGTGGDPDKLELSRPLGSGSITTTWLLKTSDSGGDPAWTVTKIDAPGTGLDVAVTSTAQRPVWVRESDPSAAATCTASTQTVGCRGLQITYTGTGTATRVSSVARVIGAASQGSVVTKTLATYSYDPAGKLASVCSGVPAAGKQALCVSYTYTTVSSRTLLATVTPPGLKPWRFDYDAIGRLTTVKRERPTGGDSTWSVDYTLTPASAGLPDLSAATAAQWGQQTVPTKVFAVYAPFTGAGDVTKAELYYTTSDGATTNTAGYGPSGWLVDASWYDAVGNEIQHLDEAGWARVQAAPQSQRPQVAADASSYTVYNTWGGSDVAGTRVVDEYGPAHSATLNDGTSGTFRTHTRAMFDDDPNVDPALITATHGPNGLGLLVKETTATSNAARTADYDSLTTKYGYEPLVSGDGNGWTLGMPTTVSSQVDATSWSTGITRYDTSGREIESRQPGGSSGANGIGDDAHSTVTMYYTAAPGSGGDCEGRPAWDGLVCKVGPPAASADQAPVTTVTDYNEDFQPTTVADMANGATRTTTTAYDALGRPTAMTRATTGQGVSNDSAVTSYGYDENTGLSSTITSDGSTISLAHDTWGRSTTYVDEFGTSSGRTYDDAGNMATYNDGAATYTYSYDGHGVLSSVNAGGGVGTFSFVYNATGDLGSVTYPSGLVAQRRYDEVGTPVALTYSQGSTELLAFSGVATADGRTRSRTSSQSSQRFQYDGLGRLTRVDDERSGGCTTRTYGFDASSNRNSFASYGPASNLTCQTTTTTVNRSNTYDSAGRIRNAGYQYDALGRTLTTPQVDAGTDAAGDLVASYHVSDQVASLNQSVYVGGTTRARTMTFELDPADRINSIVSTENGIETRRLRYRYAGDDDMPAIIDTSTDAGNTWNSTRYVIVPVIGMAASSDAANTTLQVANMHGDVVATIDGQNGSAAISSYSETDEFGAPLASTLSSRYGWLGTHQRSSDTLGGLRLMGARAYNPSTGMFLSTDAERREMLQNIPIRRTQSTPQICPAGRHISTGGVATSTTRRGLHQISSGSGSLGRCSGRFSRATTRSTSL